MSILVFAALASLGTPGSPLPMAQESATTGSPMPAATYALRIEEAQPYDMGPVIERAREREAAWESAEWRIKKLPSPGVEATEPLADPKQVVVRIRPETHWAHIQTGTREETFRSTESELLRREIRSAPGLPAEEVYMRTPQPSGPSLPLALSYEFGWNYRGKPLSSAIGEYDTAYDLGEVEWNGRTCDQVLVVTDVPNDDNIFPAFLLFLDAQDSKLILREQGFDPIQNIAEYQPQRALHNEPVLTWDGTSYVRSYSFEVSATETLAGFARPSLTRMLFAGTSKIDAEHCAIEANLPPEGGWPAGSFELDIPAGAVVQGLPAGDT